MGKHRAIEGAIDASNSEQANKDEEVAQSLGKPCQSALREIVNG